jgi:sugar (pentulose or hexulose) kinase
MIGLDLGTSALKALALDASGQVVARARMAYPTHRPAAGAAEQNPADWWAALTGCCDQLTRQVAAESWGGIGLSAMMPTLVTLDAAYRPLGPAITWQDTRASSCAAQLVERFGAAWLYETTGQRLDGRYLLPMARQARRGEDTVAGAKDYLLYRLTGHLATDPSTATGYGAFDLRSGHWDGQILDGAKVPPVVPGVTSYALSDAAAAALGCPAGLPVTVGAADSVMAAHGLGLTTGQIIYVAGTSTVILGLAADRRLDPDRRYLVTPLAGAGFGLEMDLVATGSALAWLARLLRPDGSGATAGLRGDRPGKLDDAAATASASPQRFAFEPGGLEVNACQCQGDTVRWALELAEQSDPDSAPIFLPHVAPGEQGALWNSQLTGLVSGLTLATGAGDLVRGLITGIVVESRRCLAVLADQLGDPTGEVITTGSGAGSALLRQELADASGRPVRHVAGEGDHSAIGAAKLAWQAAGHDAQLGGSLAASQSGLTLPDPARADWWSAAARAADQLRQRVFQPD